MSKKFRGVVINLLVNAAAAVCILAAAAGLVLGGMYLVSSVAEAAPQKNWVVIGDSIMSGVPDGSAGQLSLNLVSAERNVVFKSIASPGHALGARDHTGFNNQTTIESIKSIGGFFSDFDGILIQAGTNDFGRNIPLADTVESLNRIMAFARKNGKKVLVLDPLWRANENTKNKLGLTLHHYRYVMSSMCAVDYRDICRLASRSNTVMGSAAGAAFYDHREVRGNVQLHPNAAGNRHMANWIKQAAAAARFF